MTTNSTNTTIHYSKNRDNCQHSCGLEMIPGDKVTSDISLVTCQHCLNKNTDVTKAPELNKEATQISSGEIVKFAISKSNFQGDIVFFKGEDSEIKTLSAPSFFKEYKEARAKQNIPE